MMNDEKILLTGGTGFLGSYLLRYLVGKGYRHVRVLKRPGSSLAMVEEVKDEVEWVEGDILDTVLLEDAMKGIRQVYHCAALISFDPREVKKMMETNVDGTANVVNAALYEGVEKLVHVSSIAAIGRSKYQGVVSEKTDWQRSKYNSNYAISKYLAEREAWRGMAEGLEVAVVNPSIILGSGDWNTGALQLFKFAWKEFPFYPGGSSGFVDVRDVARMMIQLMESNICGERFIANAENLPYRTLMEQLARHLGKRPPSIKLNALMQQIAWRLDWIRTYIFGSSPTITRETARHTSRQFIYRHDKSINELSFRYTPISKTIADVCLQFVEASQDGFGSRYLPLNHQ